MRLLALALAGAAWAAGAVASPQAPSPRDIYKGKVREGLYELRNEADLSAVPGLPKEAAKKTEVRQVCLGKADIERGAEPGPDCRVTSYRPGDRAAHVVMECKDGTKTDMKYSFAADGFSSEFRTTGKEAGKDFTAIYRRQARYVGACPKKQ